jgi:starch synthase
MPSSKITKALKHLITEPSQEPEKTFKILIVAAESAPFATVGGFSQVVAYLSRQLMLRGHDVRVFMPKFGLIEEEKYKLKTVIEGLAVPTGDADTPELICNVKLGHGKYKVPTYFLENMEYYEKRANVYGYSDDSTRWALLSRGVIEFIKTKEFVPEIIHTNDWHAGIVANYIKTDYSTVPEVSDIPVVFTIHNLMHQGMFNHHNVPELDYDDGRSPVASFFSDRLKKQNFLRRGILYSDAINTVSKTYSKEILTPDYGEKLDRLLLEVRSKLFGIVNGLDYDEFNPATDNLLEQNYDINTLDMRVKNKIALQKEYDLPEDPNIPLFGYVGRLDGQKGVDLAVNTLRHVMEDFNIQFVQVGGGDGGIAEMLYGLRNDFPEKVGIHPFLNFTLSHLLFAGCDCMLLPSRFEPCGIVQLESMRYGCIPIVRRIGGLADTVEDFDSSTGEGTGFVFTSFSEFSLFGQIIRALEIYRNKKMWSKLQTNAMSKDFSWDYSAREYERLYTRAISLRRNKNPRDTTL